MVFNNKKFKNPDFFCNGSNFFEITYLLCCVFLIFLGVISAQAAEPKLGKNLKPDPETQPDQDSNLLLELSLEGLLQVVRPQALPPIGGSGFYAGSRTVHEVGLDDLSETLAQTPGVLVEHAGGGLSPSRVSIRGSRSGQVLVLWDDEPLNEEQPRPSAVLAGGEDGVDLNLIPATWIDSVEVVRGAAVALSGSVVGGISGLVRLRSKPQQGWGFQTTKGEFLDALQLYGSIPQTGLAGHQLAMVFNYRKSDDNYIFYDSRQVAGSQGNSCAEKLRLFFYIRHCQKRLFTHGRIDWLSSLWQRRIEFSEQQQQGLGGLADPRPYGKRRIFRWRISQRRLASNWGFAIAGSGLKGERDENTQLFNPEEENRWNDNKARLKLERHWKRQAYQLQLEGGLIQQQLRDQKINSKRLTQFIRLHAEHRGSQTANELSLRYDHIRDQQLNKQSQDQQGVPQNIYISSWRVASSLKLSSYWGTKFSLGKAHIPPNLYQRYDPSLPPTESLANPLLKTERSSSQDGGLFFQSSPHFYAEWIAFQQRIYNNIVPVARVENPIQFRFENVHQVRARGSESLLGWRKNNTYLDASLTRLNARIYQNNSNDSRYNGNLVPAKPQRQISMRLGMQLLRWQTEISSRYFSRRYLNQANTRFIEPYRLYHFKLGFSPTSPWDISLNIKNLTNITYAERENYPTAGRQWFLNVAFRALPLLASSEGKH